jgi:hypothetical protein
MTATTSWPQAWASTQDAFLKAMFLSSPGAGSESPNAPASLQGLFDEACATWKESVAKWAEFSGDEAKPEPFTPERWRELFSPARWFETANGPLDAGLRHVLEGPKYALLFTLDRELMQLHQLAMQRDKDVSAFQAVLMKGWNAAIERFGKQRLEGKVGAPVTWCQMTDAWLAVLNDTFIGVYRSDEFVEAQRRMVRSASDHRIQEGKLAETWCEAAHVPTRTEMDEVQRTVIELRRQVRALQRAAGGIATPPTADAAPPRKRAGNRRARTPQA